MEKKKSTFLFSIKPENLTIGVCCSLLLCIFNKTLESITRVGILPLGVRSPTASDGSNWLKADPVTARRLITSLGRFLLSPPTNECSTADSTSREITTRISFPNHSCLLVFFFCGILFIFLPCIPCLQTVNVIVSVERR